MADQPNLWQTFLYNLREAAKTHEGAAEAEALQRLTASALHNDSQHPTLIRELLDTYGEKYGVSGADRSFALQQALDEQANREDFAPERQNEFQAAERPSAALTALSRLFKHEKKPNPSTGVHTGDTASPALRSVQEQELLLAFDKALAIENPQEQEEAINRLLEHLEAPDLLEEQWKAAVQHAQETDSFQKEKPEEQEKILKQLEEQKNLQKKRFADDWEEADKTEEGRKAKAELQKRKRELLANLERARHPIDEEGKPKKANPQEVRAAFQALIQESIHITENYSVFIEYAEQDKDLFLLELSRILGRRWQDTYIKRVQLQEEERKRNASGHADEGLYTDTGGKPQTSQPTTPLRALANAAKSPRVNGISRPTLQSLARRGITKLKKEAIKRGLQWAFFSPPYVGEIIVAIILIILLVVIIVVVIVLLFTQNNSNQTTSGLGITPQQDCINQSQDSQGHNKPTKELAAQLGTWGFILSGEHLDDPMIQQTFQTICILHDYPKYWQLLHPGDGNTIILKFTGSGGGGFTQYFGAGEGQTTVISIYGSHDPEIDYNRFTLIHEMGHMFSHRNQNIQDSFDKQFLRPASLSANPPGLPTINCQAEGLPLTECFADMQGLYFTYSSGFDDFASYLISNNKIHLPVPPYPSLIVQQVEKVDTDLGNYSKSTSPYYPFYQFAHDNIFGDPPISSTTGGTASGNSPAFYADYITSDNPVRLYQGGGSLNDQFMDVGGYDIKVGNNTYHVFLRDNNPPPAPGPAKRYWCTNLVIDSYNLFFGGNQTSYPIFQPVVYKGVTFNTGYNGTPFTEAVGNVTVMMHFFQNNYVFVGPNGWYNNMKKDSSGNVIPGEAIFFNFGDRSAWGTHTGIISQVVVTDPTAGEGYILTDEANAGSKHGKYSFYNHYQLYESYVVGFGEWK